MTDDTFCLGGPHDSSYNACPERLKCSRFHLVATAESSDNVAWSLNPFSEYSAPCPHKTSVESITEPRH